MQVGKYPADANRPTTLFFSLGQPEAASNVVVFPVIPVTPVVQFGLNDALPIS